MNGYPPGEPAGTRAISIVLCTFNGEAYLPDLLESLVEQTFLPAELVWRDDGSTDATARIAKEFSDRAPFPVIFSVNDENLGPVQNFGRAMAEVTGSHIALCDQDDVWLPGKLESMIGQFENPAIKLVYTDCLVVDSNLESTGQTFLAQRGTQHPKMNTLSHLLFENTVTGCVCMFSSELLPTALPIPESAIMHDWWMGLVAAAAGEVRFLPEVTTLYRQHGDNVLGAPGRFSRASLEEAGVPFGIARKAARNFVEAANQAIALDGRLQEQNRPVPRTLESLVVNLDASRYKMWRTFRKLDVQRGDWVRNLSLLIGLLTHNRADVADRGSQP